MRSILLTITALLIFTSCTKGQIIKQQFNKKHKELHELEYLKGFKDGVETSVSRDPSNKGTFCFFPESPKEEAYALGFNDGYNLYKNVQFEADKKSEEHYEKAIDKMTDLINKSFDYENNKLFFDKFYEIKY